MRPIRFLFCKHQWDAAKASWQKIGQVVDAVGQAKKKMFGNVEYDYVFDVDIQEGVPPLKLPFNIGDNPYQAAQTFIEQNELSQAYLDQIANFIITNANVPTIGTSQYVDPFTGGSRYVPAETAQPTPVKKYTKLVSIS